MAFCTQILESLCRLAAARGGLDAFAKPKKVMDLDEQQYYSALKYVINSLNFSTFKRLFCLIVEACFTIEAGMEFSRS